jgi:hypothetical protein
MQKTNRKTADRHRQDHNRKRRAAGYGIENMTEPSNRLRKESTDISQKRTHYRTSLHPDQTAKQTNRETADRHSQDEDQKRRISNNNIKYVTEPTDSSRKERAYIRQEISHSISCSFHKKSLQQIIYIIPR